MNKVEKNQKIGISYSLKDTNGRVIEEVPPTHPIIYLHGYNNIVPGLETALSGHGVGERLTVPVRYEDGYGPYQQDLVMEISKDELRDVGEIWVGMEIEMFQDNPEEDSETGFHIPEDPADFYKDEPTSDDPSLFVVREIREKTVLLDGNHPLAGMDLVFDVSIISIMDASVTEIEMGYPDEPEDQDDAGGEAPDSDYGRRRWR
jgi:FKBP-type peptidyl-prolyl cis-trans isomerase SlyD